jgi:hypothetical protein
MDVESRLGGALERGGATVRPDLPHELREVRRRARRRTTVRRATAVGAAGAAVVAIVTAAQLIGSPLSERGGEPVAPSRELTPPSKPVSLSVVREATAQALGLEQVLSVAVAPDGHVYATDASQTVTELTADLDVVRTWGGPGTGPGEFRFVQGSIAVGPDGRVYVSDSGNFRVQVFSSDGRYIRSMGEFGTGAGQFTWPFDLAVDDGGHVYLADDKQMTLTKLSPTGRQIWRRGGDGETDPRLLGHEHLSALHDGRVVTANDDAGVVLFLDADGTVVDEFGGTESGRRPDQTFTGAGLFPGGACDATVDQHGFIYVTSCQDIDQSHLTSIFDATHETVGSWPDNPLISSPRFGPTGRGYAVTISGGIAEVRATVG